MISDVTLPSHYSPSSGSGASGSSSLHVRVRHLDGVQDEERDFKITSMFSSVDEAIKEHAEQEEVSLPSDVESDDEEQKIDEEHEDPQIDEEQEDPHLAQPPEPRCCCRSCDELFKGAVDSRKLLELSANVAALSTRDKNTWLFDFI